MGNDEHGWPVAIDRDAYGLAATVKAGLPVIARLAEGCALHDPLGPDLFSEQGYSPIGDHVTLKPFALLPGARMVPDQLHHPSRQGVLPTLFGSGSGHKPRMDRLER